VRSWPDEFGAVLDDLGSNPLIRVDAHHVHPPTGADAIAAIEEEFGVALPGSIRDFHRQMGGLELRWTSSVGTAVEGVPARGSIRLLPLEQVFAGRDDDEWFGDLWFDWMDESSKEALRALKPVDYFDQDDSGCTCLQVGSGVVQPRLRVHGVDHGVRVLDLGFEEYLELLVRTRGFHGWPLLLVEDREDLFDHEQRHASFHHGVSRLFPGSDFSEFE
jgi:hypothetical protein